MKWRFHNPQGDPLTLTDKTISYFPFPWPDPIGNGLSPKKEARLLTRRHLAVLRAALQFFDEEFLPHGSRAMRPYFDEPLRVALKPLEIHELRKFLRDCQLKYAGYDRVSGRLTDLKPSLSARKVRRKNSDLASQIAVLLLPRG